VVAVAVNTAGMSADTANEATFSITAETGLPTADPIRNGPEELLTAVRSHLDL
jgi:uncharacterized NAD-dependent epimerase/dehydratase family protein